MVPFDLAFEGEMMAMSNKIATVIEMLPSYGSNDHELANRYRKYIEGGGRRFFLGEKNPFVETFIVTRKIDGKIKSFYGWEGMDLERNDTILALKFMLGITFFIGGKANLDVKCKGMFVTDRDMDLGCPLSQMETTLCKSIGAFMVQGENGPIQRPTSIFNRQKVLTPVKIQTAGGVMGIRG
jgi:hypothetical protein